MKKILYANLIGLISIACYGFTPPSGNTTVMVNGSNVLVNPTATQLIDANPELSDYFKINGWQVNIDTTPSVNPIDGYQTQLKTLEINTPNIDLTDLLQGKLNRGELWFGGGTFTTSQKVPLTSPFSYVWTWAITSAEWANIPTSASAFLGTHSSWAGEGFVFVNMPTYIIWRIWSGGERDDTATISRAALADYLDGNPHVWAIINDGTKLNLYIDGTLIKSTAAHNWTASESTGGFSTFNMSSVKCKMSRIAGFNFDMSDANAPYTVADYQNGVDVPPTLLCGQDTVPATVGPNAWTETPGVITPATGAPLTILGGVYTWTRSAAGVVNTYSRYFFQKNLSAGATINVSFGNITAVNSQFTSCYLFYTDNTKSTAQSIVQNSTLSLTAEKEVKAVEINFRFTSSALENDTLQLDALKIHINGALLDLENYTFDDGNGQKVYDISGNGNDATVSGTVKGTNDAAIAVLYKAFTGNNAILSGSGYPPTGGSVIETLRAALNPDGTAYTTLYQYEDDIVVLTEWTDSEFKVLDSDGNLIYWVSTQWGAQMGTDYTTNPAADLNAKIFYTSPENEANGTGKGREWIEYVHNDVNARTIYEHAQGITGSATPTIGGIIIQPNFSGTTVGGTSIQSIFGKNVLDAPTGNQFIYLKASPTNLEKTKASYPIWRTIRPTAIQGGN